MKACKTHLTRPDCSPLVPLLYRNTPDQHLIMTTPQPRIEAHWLPNKALTRPRYFTPTSVVLTLCFLETLSQGYWRVIMKGEKERSEYRIGSLNRSGLSSLLPALLPLFLPLPSPFIHVFLLWIMLSLSKFEWNTLQTGTVFHWSLIVEQLFNLISSQFLPCPHLSLSLYPPLHFPNNRALMTANRGSYQ